MNDVKIVAMIFAERVIVEQDSHKHTIIGAFDRFNADGFPAIFLPWTIYAAVSNLEGDHTFTMTLVRDEGDELVVSINGGFKVAEKLDVVQLVVPVTGVVFPKEGNYTLGFQVDGEPVGSRVLRVMSSKGATAT